MTEKRYYIGNGRNCTICDKQKGGSDFFNMLTQFQAVDKLNELNEENIELHIQNDFLKDENQHMKSVLKENKELKSILQDMGLIMSNEEVKNVRDEIASKLIKPVCKGNGFDVDVNTENGFTIIPKEDFE